MKKLTKVEEGLANFFAQGLLRLGRKLGPVLWQFPPQFIFNRSKLEAFFKLLPRTMGGASLIARAHRQTLRGRVCTEIERADSKRMIRHCMEIRYESFAVPEFIQVLREHNVGLVVADTVDWPLLMDVTADFVYCRLHGSEHLYASGYADAALDR